METLLTWFKENNIILDERLEITTSEEKGTFIKAKSNIPSKVAGKALSRHLSSSY